MPGPGYGYKNRRDPAPAEISGGTSRITLPESQETRRTDIVSKTNFGVPTVVQANVDDFYLFSRLSASQPFVGKNTATSVGASAARWNTDIKRYSLNISQNSSLVDFRHQLGLSPRSLVDPLFPPSGIVVKVQDLVRAGFLGAVNTQVAKALFLIGPPVASSLSLFDMASIGWNARYTNAGVQPTWATQYSDKTRTVTRTFDSGLSCDVPRLLSFVLDGKKQTIRWYADQVLVDEYAPSAGEVGGQTTLLGRDSVHWVCSCVNAFPGPGFGASFDFLMLGAPTVTIQFPDA